MEITEQDRRDYRPLIDLAREIPGWVREKMLAAHGEVGWGCAAHGEGQRCCLDFLEAGPG